MYVYTHTIIMKILLRYIYIYIYEGRLKSLCDDVISAVDDFLTNEIQSLQYQWKKCVDTKGDYVEI